MNSGPVPVYRLSDAERDEAISALSDAFVDGRLDSPEFQRRMESASSATFASELDPLFVDLPVRRTRSVPVPVPVQRQRQRRAGILPAALAVVAIIALLTHVWLLIPAMVILAHRRRRHWPAGAGWSPGCGYRSRGSSRPVNTS